MMVDANIIAAQNAYKVASLRLARARVLDYSEGYVRRCECRLLKSLDHLWYIQEKAKEFREATGWGG
jgi:hypothetical protein